MHESVKWKWSRSVVSDSSRPHGLQPTRLLCPQDFPGKSTGVGGHCFLPIVWLYYCKQISSTFNGHLFFSSFGLLGIQLLLPFFFFCVCDSLVFILLRQVHLNFKNLKHIKSGLGLTFVSTADKCLRLFLILAFYNHRLSKSQIVPLLCMVETRLSFSIPCQTALQSDSTNLYFYQEKYIYFFRKNIFKIHLL